MMTFINDVGIAHPIIQAPMAGVTTPEFVAASSEAGILGSIGAGYLSAETTREFIQQVKTLTDKPFAVNLFVPENTEMDQEQMRKAHMALQPVVERLGMPFWKASLSESDFDKQVDIIIEEGVQICTFTFGIPDQKTIQKLKNAGVLLIGTATTKDEAIAVEKAGVDAVVAQGIEAGGHRGSFIGEEYVPLHDLLSDVVGAIKIPVIAAGGIANKEQMDAAIRLGAQAVQIGTALLAADESGAHPLYKKAVLASELGCTQLTKAFSGKSARGIRNSFMDMMANAPIAPYPYQNDLTKKIRSEAARLGKSEFMSLWAGERVHETNSGSVKEIVDRLI